MRCESSRVTISNVPTIDHGTGSGLHSEGLISAIKCIGFTPPFLSSALPRKLGNLCNPLHGLGRGHKTETDRTHSMAVLSLVCGYVSIVSVHRMVTFLSIISGVLKNSRPIARASYVPSSSTPQAFLSFQPPAEKNGVSPKISLKIFRSISAIPHEAKTAARQPNPIPSKPFQVANVLLFFASKL